MRPIAERAFSRAAGAPLVAGNSIGLLLDAEANYAAWLDAIRAARTTVYFENYIIRPDEVGLRFRDALIERANRGVKVRVLLDWLGSLGTPRRFWKPLLEAGGRVRWHNPPRLDSPLGWLSRDHRKSLVVDGSAGFVSGVCVSRSWLGNPGRGVEPWRDTGLELHGPAVVDLVSAFAQVWAENGPVISKEELAVPVPEVAGEVSVRVIAAVPNISGIYRLDLLIAAMAQKRLWLTDAYFAGVPAYVQALRSAARDGVDVRLLVPGGSDLPWLRLLSTAGYRPLLEAGVRVFEWNGSMLHAKSAVADGRWARVGSTNLNIASWLTNYELDVAVEDTGFAQLMEQTYESDLAHSTELMIRKRRPVRLAAADPPVSRPGRGSLVRATAGAIRIGRTVSAAMMNQRLLGPSEARPLALSAFVPLGFALLAIFFPRVVAWPLAVLSAILAIMLTVRAWRLRRVQK